MYDLIMRKRKQETGIIVIHHGKSQFMIFPASVFRICAEIIQSIVHPAHIPFIVESQSPVLHGIGNLWKRGRILGCKDRRRMELFQPLVHVLEEFHCISVYTPGRISLPVDSSADGIHSQTVYMVFGQPVIGGGLQEAPYVSTGMHKVAASPFADTYGRMRILVQSCPVILSQTIAVQCKMYRYKVHDHANAILMTAVNKIFQLIRSAVSGSGAEKACGLITPGFIAGIFVQRHDLQIIVAVVFYIGNQDFCHFFIGIPGICFFGWLFKRTEMQFINIQRLLAAVRAGCHPFFIVERIALLVPYNRG